MPLNKLRRQLSRWNYQRADEADMRAFAIRAIDKILDNYVIINAFENKRVVTNSQEYLKRKHKALSQPGNRDKVA